MDERLNCMSETCATLKKLADWVHSQPIVPVIFAGKGGYGFETAPAPYIEICYLEKGFEPELHIGDLTVAIPCNHAGIMSVHQGNLSAKPGPRPAWCAFIDVSQAKEFRYLHKTPLFHDISVDNPNELLRAFHRLSMRCRKASWSSPVYPPLKPFWETRDADRIDTIDRLAINSAMTELLVTLLAEAQKTSSQTVPQIPPAIQDSVDYIELHYCDPEISVSDIAASANLSQEHFIRVFHKHIGESPFQYLRRTRIDRSMQLLKDTDNPIQNICWSVGFKDPFHFSKVFQKFTGMSPTKFRKS